MPRAGCFFCGAFAAKVLLVLTASRPARQRAPFLAGGTLADLGLGALVKTRLERMPYRTGLIDGFLAKTGLDLTLP